MDHDAIRKAYPSIWTLDDSFVNYGLDKDGNKVSIEQSKVDAARGELSKLDYKFDRLNNYPSIADQLDLIYHSGIDAWKAKIKETKDAYPKP
jgi:hypothetical protein|tara:strand:- start:101 stop:376 length:276 start_codon:yes stop_codon:yes gene_type:complete